MWDFGILFHLPIQCYVAPKYTILRNELLKKQCEVEIVLNLEEF